MNAALAGRGSGFGESIWGKSTQMRITSFLYSYGASEPKIMGDIMQDLTEHTKVQFEDLSLGDLWPLPML